MNCLHLWLGSSEIRSVRLLLLLYENVSPHTTAWRICEIIQIKCIWTLWKETYERAGWWSMEAAWSPRTISQYKSNWSSVPLFVLNCWNSQSHLKAGTADCNATCTECGEDYLPTSGSICLTGTAGRLPGQLTSIVKWRVQRQRLLVDWWSRSLQVGEHTSFDKHTQTIAGTGLLVQIFECEPRTCCWMLKCTEAKLIPSLSSFICLHSTVTQEHTKSTEIHTHTAEHFDNQSFELMLADGRSSLDRSDIWMEVNFFL